MSKLGFFVFVGLMVVSFFLGRLTSSPEIREVERIREVKIPDLEATQQLASLSSQLREAHQSLDKLRVDLAKKQANGTTTKPAEPELEKLREEIDRLLTVNKQLGQQLVSLLALHSEDIVTKFAQGHEIGTSVLPSLREMVAAGLNAGLYPTAEQVGKIAEILGELNPKIDEINLQVPENLRGREKDSWYTEELTNWRFARRSEFLKQRDDKVAQILGVPTNLLFPDDE